ncbi:conserved hypothetical protein [uncultured Desulfobacterium sp.]|uniref:Uncharacterized protein n=1 Tax=uncultured Desulfobacterium sp. TaxID=201089 RepID=A0A445MT29_9BACT|nr:conserved hypothetical protein [uncultured Desulfobacterium sp.]
MRSYLIDEVSSSDMEKVSAFLSENAIKSNLNQLYWVKIPDDLLSEKQYQHLDCRPHAFAVELGSDWIKLEFLVRSLKHMRCDCPGYSTKQQQDFIINFARNMIEQLNIKT